MRTRLFVIVVLVLAVAFQVWAAEKKVKLMTLACELHVGSAMPGHGHTAAIVSGRLP